MAGHDTLNTHGRARLSFANEADIDEFVVMLEKYERGEITPDQWRSFRLLRGTYGQRQSYDASMLRVKIPQGAISADQLNALADVADKYSRRFGHITTRQNIQLHFVKIHDIEHAMRALSAAGMTTREACGNSVRNITACPYAGTSADELFDVTPYSEATTRFLLRHRLSSTLPRKFKIAFEGCREDHIAIAINDLAFKAEFGPNGERGFKVLAGGGTALMCKSAGIIHEFTPASELFRVSEAMLIVFKEHGDYEHRQRNRMKFMIKKLGWDRFVEEYQKALAWCVGEGQVPQLSLDSPDVEAPPRLGTDRGTAADRDRGAGLVRAAEWPGNHADRRAGAQLERRAVPALEADERARAEAVRFRRRDSHRAARRSDERADARARRPGPIVWRRRRAGDRGSEPALPLGAGGRAARTVSASCRGRPRVARCRHCGRREQLPRRRVLPPRRHAVARARTAARRHAARAS
ncbi:MAG: hypothetical protein QM736_03905 [Vicinamibacterales bacterium]